MEKIQISDLTTEQWRELRKQSIGGSDVAALLGLNKYKSPYTLWAEKTGRLTLEQENTELMKQGTDLEDYVAKRFTEATGKKVKKSSFMYRHKDYDFITANIDRLVVGENAGLECKTTSVYNKSDFANGEIPHNYYCQCMHYMEVMNFDKMYLAVLVLSKGFFWFEIHRNQDEINALIKAEVDFWQNHIVQDCPPEIDGSDSTYDCIKNLFGNDEISGTVCNLSSIESEINQYQSIKNQLKYLGEEEKRLKNLIISKLGNNVYGKCSQFDISYKAQSTARLNTTELKKQLPDIYEKYVTKTESKVLRIKVEKEKK